MSVEKRHADFLQVIAPRFNKDCKAMAAILSEASSVKVKYHKLEKIVDENMELLLPFTPCRGGCSHCCNQNVVITTYEADRIALATGIPRKHPPPPSVKEFEAMGEKYRGVPCTFLKDGKCSIYEVRPFPCRTHHTINDSSEECALIKDDGALIAKVNLVHIVGEQRRFVKMAKLSVADIREFFDKGEK